MPQQYPDASDTHASDFSYRDIVDYSPDLITRVDSNGHFLYVNGTGETILGLPPQDCVGLSAFDFVHPSDRRSTLEAFASWKASGHHTLIFENRQVSRRGLVSLIEWHIRVERNRAGEVCGFSSIGRDITRIREQETLLAHSQNIAHIGTWKIDLSNCELCWNPECFSLYGITDDTASGHFVTPSFSEFLQLIHPDDRPAKQQWLAQCQAGAHPAPLEYRILPSAGGYRWLLSCGDAEAGPTGLPERIIGTVQDITEIKQQQETLALSAVSLAAISQGVIISTPDLRMVYVNDAVTTITGYAKEEMLGHRCRVLSGADTDPEQLEAISAALDQRREYACEMINYRRDGTPFWNELTLSPLFNEHRQLTHFIAVVRDVSARKLAEEQVRDSEENLATTLNSIGDGVIATDAEGRITRMNPTAERLTGWPLAEANGRKLADVFNILNTQTREPVNNPVQEVMARGVTVGLSNHTTLVARDGREFQIADSASPITNTPGQIKGVVLVFSDVTEKYRIQQQLESSLEMLERTGELAQVGGWEYDLRSEKFSFTREALRINDATADDPASFDRGFELYAPEHRPMIKAAFQCAIELGQPWAFEVPRYTLKGRHIWLRSQGSAVQENGKTVKLVGAFQDITQRKHMELELRASEARYYSVVSALSEGVVIHGDDGAIVACNSSAERILDLTAEQLQGRTSADPRWGAIHEDGTPYRPEDHPGVVALHTGETQTNQIIGVNKPDGSQIWVSVNAAPIFSPDSPIPVGAVSSFVDITASKLSQAELRRTTERLELVMRGSNDAPWDWDLLADQLYYSPRWWQMLGYAETANELDPRLWRRLLHPDDATRVDEVLANALTTQVSSYEVEFRLHHKLGHYVPLLSRGFILRDECGQAVRVSGTNMDLTERKRAEDALLASQRFLTTITQGIPGMVAHWNCDLRCDFANREYLNWFGKTREQVIGATPAEVIGAQLYQENERYMLGAFRGEAVSVHRTHEKPDGTKVDLWTQYLPDVHGDEVVGMFVLVSDITPLKNTERALQASLKDKEALLKEVHHRVKNNLQIINSLLRLESGRSEQIQTRHVLSDMQDRIRAMALLHESLQHSGTFAAIDLGIYLRQLSSQSFRALASSASSVDLQLDLDSIMLDMDHAMPCGLLVSELMSNALKHGFPNGRSGSVTVCLKAVGSHVELVVSDTGVGLPANFAEKRTQSLGLQLVSDLVTQLDGQMTIGPGACFKVVFSLN